MTRPLTVWIAALAFTLAAAGISRAQDADRAVKLAEPDFTLVALPTSLNVPMMKSAFRVTHRFTRPLNCDGCLNSVVGDAFGIDNGAQIGLEYRFGIARNTQIGIHRTSDKTLAVFGQFMLTRQTGDVPLETAVLVGTDITNVGRREATSEYSPTVGFIAGRLVGSTAALYVEPIFVHHSNTFNLAGDRSTLMIGLGARIRIRPTVYVTGEVTPRISGYGPGAHQGSLALEKRAGGHMFQLNVSNGLGTTMGQIARGGPSGNDWHLGFNISRKFF